MLVGTLHAVGSLIEPGHGATVILGSRSEEVGSDPTEYVGSDPTFHARLSQKSDLTLTYPHKIHASLTECR